MRVISEFQHTGNAGVVLFQLKGLSHVYRLVKTDHPESSADAADHITDSLAAHPKVSHMGAGRCDSAQPAAAGRRLLRAR